MELYFLRHAIAADPQTAGFSEDSERPLVAEGVKKMKKAAKGMKSAVSMFDRVISSPYVRARETAEIVVNALAFPGTVEFSESLIPGADFREFAKLLKQFSGEDRVLFVSHEPTISHFVSRLVSSGQDVSIDIKKSSLCRVDLADGVAGHGQLKWLLSPKLLQSMAYDK